jgi:hypothetical protein
MAPCHWMAGALQEPHRRPRDIPADSSLCKRNTWDIAHPSAGRRSGGWLTSGGTGRRARPAGSRPSACPSPGRAEQEPFRANLEREARGERKGESGTLSLNRNRCPRFLTPSPACDPQAHQNRAIRSPGWAARANPVERNRQIGTTQYPIRQGPSQIDEDKN